MAHRQMEGLESPTYYAIHRPRRKESRRRLHYPLKRRRPTKRATDVTLLNLGEIGACACSHASMKTSAGGCECGFNHLHAHRC